MTSWKDFLLSPQFWSTVVGLIAAALAALGVKLTSNRRQQIEQLFQDALHALQDWNAVTPDQWAVSAAQIIQFVDQGLVALGWRPLTVGEREYVQLRVRGKAGEFRKSLAFAKLTSVAKVVLLMLALVTGTQVAHAQTVSSGPTIPLLMVRLADPATGKAATSLLGAGAGYDLSFGFLTRELGGKQWDLLSVNLMFFGQLATEAGQALNTVSTAGAACTLNSIFCLGFGVDALQFYGGTQELTGFLVGNVQKKNLFALLSVGFNFEIGPHAPPTGVDSGPAGLIRGNTLYLSL